MTKRKNKLSRVLLTVIALAALAIAAYYGLRAYAWNKIDECEAERLAVKEPEFDLVASYWSYAEGCQFEVRVGASFFDVVTMDSKKAKEFVKPQ